MLRYWGQHDLGEVSVFVHGVAVPLKDLGGEGVGGLLLSELVGQFLGVWVF